MLVGHLLHVVEQPPVVPDAQAVVGIGRMEVAEALLPLHALPGRQLAAVLHHGHNDVVGRGGHIQGLAAVAEVLYLLHRSGLQHVAVDQCRVVLAEEGMAEGPLQRSQQRQQRAVARLGAVAHILLIVGRSYRHVVSRRQTLTTDATLFIHPFGQSVGALVRALIHQLVEAAPIGLSLCKKRYRQQCQQRNNLVPHLIGQWFFL